jgi:GT2 family glycosyltransferase
MVGHSERGVAVRSGMDWTNQDTRTLAACVVNSVALTGDRFAQTTATVLWAWSEPYHRAVVAELRGLGDPRIDGLADQLLEQPGDPQRHRKLLHALMARWDRSSKLAELAWAADCASRLSVHVGDRYDPQRPAAEENGGRSPARVAPHGGRHPVDAAIVIPFREADQSTMRGRNLAACLSALNDQTHPRERYRVVVVESDREARWRDRFASACDEYLFAHNPGLFNKSWAVNVGVVHAATPANLLCLLDGDILVDRGFVARNVARFQVPGTQGHWPFRDVLFLDEPSSRSAVHARCVLGRDAVDLGELRGVFQRRAPGCCLWLRETLFRRIGGMDERFEGWGGEDNDLVWRAELYGGLDRHPDPLVHLDHVRAPDRDGEGRPFFHETRWCTWPPGSTFGDLSKYLTAAGRE